MTAKGIVGEFLALKDEANADLLAMQCGDFYEFFGEDAEVAGRELDLKVSQKASHGSSYPMAGVPLDDLTPYLKSLVERGYRVAVADQVDDGADDIHREVTRIVTPGTLLETSDADAQYLAAVVADDGGYGLAFADVTTGHFFVTRAGTADDAYADLYRFSPVEVLLGPTVRDDDSFVARVRDETDAQHSPAEADSFAPGRARRAVREQFGRETVESLSLSELEVRAAGAVLAYVDETGTGVRGSMTRVQRYAAGDHLELDATTQRNLELTRTMHGKREGSLVDAIDHTETAAGGRLLREWLTRPLRDRDELSRRHDAVEALAREALAREGVRDALDGVYDLERLAARTASGRAGAVDLLRIRDTLAVLPDLSESVDSSRLADSPLADVVERPDRAVAADLHAELDAALRDDPPKTVRQGGLFQRGYDDELDGLIERHESALEWLDTLAEREKRRHGLAHVTVDRNKTDGYYIQVGKSVAGRVPDHYREIKTLKSSKRFVTDGLEEREREVLRLEEARADREYDLFCDLRDRVGARAELLQDVGRALAEVDTLASLAVHAAGNDWTRPDLTDPGPLHVEAGRHPVVERTTEFVPNDLHLDEDRDFLVVTGPNMSGKSTYMRQAALIVLLAQMGSFVPARAATVGVVDGIFTRVGALDELAQGRSTFMVEMQELSNILHSATEESLVILDEVGRGTSTYDGISIAWAATEYLANEVRAKTLFATHYHELTSLADRLPGVHNVHVTADERDGDVTFLRTVRDGPTDRSYGIHVADLAGVPRPVVERAHDVLARLREDRAIDVRGGGGGTKQAVFDLGSGQFADATAASADGGERSDASSGESSAATSSDGSTPDEPSLGRGPNADRTDALDPATEDVLAELRQTDVNASSPLDVMSKVQEWQRRLDEK